MAKKKKTTRKPRLVFGKDWHGWAWMDRGEILGFAERRAKPDNLYEVVDRGDDICVSFTRRKRPGAWRKAKIVPVGE